jgi:hypothetical protein
VKNTDQYIKKLIDLRHDILATQYIMNFYDIDEETAVRLYNDEIEAAKKLIVEFQVNS